MRSLVESVWLSLTELVVRHLDFVDNEDHEHLDSNREQMSAETLEVW